MFGIINNQSKDGDLSKGGGKYDFQPATLGKITSAKFVVLAENR